MFKGSIIKKTVFSIMVVAILYFGALNLVINLLIQNNTKKKQLSNIETYVNYITKELYGVSEEDDKAIEQIKYMLKSISKTSVYDYALVDSKGKVLYNSDGSADLNKPFDLEKYGEPQVIGDEFQGSLSGVFSSPGYTLIDTAKYEKDQVNFYVVVHGHMSSIEEESDMILMWMNTSGVIAIILMLVIGISISRRYVKNINLLIKLTVDYTNGNYDERLEQQVGDEQQKLADSIYLLGEKTQGIIDYQKNFVANVSHDFRSPLTSIKGYTGAIKDGTIPYEAQDKYLDIILFEADRLTGLTQNLLRLNEFDSKGVKLELSEFNICDMIKKAARTFEATCASKNLKIRLVLAEREIWVKADQSKIQQVLHNLIDNAIKFSNEESYIHITVSEKDWKVFVSVKDFGIGIPKESQSQIWERFYKTDLSRGKDKKGTGLGLSIVKQIINAHKENITVDSTVGEGTEFKFSLQRVNKPKTM